MHQGCTNSRKPTNGGFGRRGASLATRAVMRHDPLTPMLLLVLMLLGCSFAHVNHDLDTRPETSAGMGATVLYPGQRPPAIGAQAPASAQRPEARNARAEPDVTMIGGNSSQEKASKRIRNTPLGPLTTLVGYPFWIFGKSLSEAADEAATQQTPETPAPTTADQRERNRLAHENDELLRQLQPTGAAPGTPAIPSRHAATRPRDSKSLSSARPGSRPGSIGAELAALRNALAPEPSAPSLAPHELPPSRVLDRDQDGRPDLFVYGPVEAPERELFDDDQDGSPNRVVIYGADGLVSRVEEDADGDGRLESVAMFERGQPVRKRADTGQDGEIDSWSFFREGELVRHEVDRNGDGFRDLFLWYDSGQLVREEEDGNDDGRPDLINHYRDGELVQREEDPDFDGIYDIRSFFLNGKLLRKEVRGEIPSSEENSPALERTPGT